MRVNRLRLRDRRGIAHRKKNNTVPYRCVAANCRNVVDRSEGIFVHNIPFFGDKTTISWKYNRPSGNRFKQQFLRNMPWWKLLTNDRSVKMFIDPLITSHISLELANRVWPKLETCVISQCFGCQLLWFHSVVVFLFVDTRWISEVKRCDHDQLRNIQIHYLEVDKYHCTQNHATKKL